MSEQQVRAVRAVYERWARGDFAASLDVFATDVVFALPPPFPEAGTYRGLERIKEYTREFLEPWTHITIDAEELTETDDTVLAAVVQRGAGDLSGAVTEFRYYQVWWFRGGKVVRLENFRERADARAAAGLG
jgi:ketosteroid isomerase-like protein